MAFALINARGTPSPEPAQRIDDAGRRIVSARSFTSAASKPFAPLSCEDVHCAYLEEIELRLRRGFVAAGLVREMIEYQLRTGGKRARALLPIWVCVNMGGRAEAALDLGVGLELLHNATLIHDDLQDGDAYRRGQPTIWRRWGKSQAINAGDALFFEAFRCFARAPAGPRLLETMTAAMVRLAEGQSMEFQLQLAQDHPHALPPTLRTWEAVARRKTGMLFAACLRAGAAAAEQDEPTVQAAGDYGEALGLLFQLQDDYLDLIGDKGRHGRGSDLVEGKLSFPVLWAYEHGSAEAVAPIRALFALPREERTAARVSEAIAAMQWSGALAATAAWLSAAAEAAQAHMFSAVIPGWIDRCLAPVAHAMAPTGASVPTDVGAAAWFAPRSGDHAIADVVP